MKIKDTNKLPFLITFCLAVGGLLMALFMCGYVEFGIHSTVGKIAVYIAFLLQALNTLLIRLRIRNLIKAGAPAPSKGMRHFYGLFLWVWRLGAMLLVASAVLSFCGLGNTDPWVRYTCLAGVCLLPLGWIGSLAACRRRAQAALVAAQNQKN